MDKIKSIDKTPLAGENVEQLESSHTDGESVEPLWKTVWQSCTKLSLLFPYDLVIVLFGTCPNELKSYVHTKTCTHCLYQLYS